MRNYFYLWIAEFWTGLILFLCFTAANNIPSMPILCHFADKYVHFTFHFIFVTLWFLYFKTKFTNLKKVVGCIFLCAVTFGICIEIGQQLLTDTRKFDVFDIVANTAGAGIATLLILLKIKFLINENV